MRWNLPALTALSLLLAISALAQTKPRARGLGVPFDGTPGPNNAITDVKGVEVGDTTLISGEGKLVVGKGRYGQESPRFFPAAKQITMPSSPDGSRSTAMAR